MPHARPRPTSAPRAALALLLCALALPRPASAVDVFWGSVNDFGTQIGVNFIVSNDNPGTTYTSVELRSSVPLFELLLLSNNDRYATVSELANGLWLGIPNVQIAVNSDAGYVNHGWDAYFGDDGRVVLLAQPGNPFADDFHYGHIFAGTLLVSKHVLRNGLLLRVAPNAAGATDTAYDTDVPFLTQPSYLPLPGRSLSLGVPRLLPSAAGSDLALEVESVGLWTFLLEGSTPSASLPSGLSRTPLGTYAATGLVTRVVDTNAPSARLYRAVGSEQ